MSLQPSLVRSGTCNRIHWNRMNDCMLSLLCYDWDDVSGTDNMCYTLIGLVWLLWFTLSCQSVCCEEIGLHECVNHYDVRRQWKYQGDTFRGCLKSYYLNYIWLTIYCCRVVFCLYNIMALYNIPIGLKIFAL